MITRHLSACEERLVAQLDPPAGRDPLRTVQIMQLIVSGAPNYWLHIEIPADAQLQQLDQFLAGLHTLTGTHVYVANLPQLALLPFFKHGTVPLATVTAQTQQWNVVIAQTSAKYGDILVDLYNSDLASHPEYIYGDGLHPSTLGYRVLANTFWSVIMAHGGPNA